jgi:succinate dehydrogenase / fumarate reductase iron-sulfur subunit/fumarate reductase iron-sulfur subunit
MEWLDRSARTLTVDIRRSSPGSRTQFDVEAHDPVTVLDLLSRIQREQDPSLGFRYSCRVAMCGTCALGVDGRSTLACRSVIPPGVNEVSIAPLAGLPVVRDLIVDTQPFWAEWSRVLPWFVPGAVDRVENAPDQARMLDRALGCISCGACYSTCDVVRRANGYLGPAALNRALALIADPRDAATAERLAIVGGGDGVDRCRYVGACTAACPVGLDPSRSIAELRRLRIASRA